MDWKLLNRTSARANLAFALLLLVGTLLAYQPAWHGGVLWDDDDHITKPHMRSLQGLGHIWTSIREYQQAYPVTHTAFWLQHRLWADHTLGYHLVNISLHALNALLVLAILRQLHVPGAYLAAILFAFHPVHVESVAWITELKNCLSGAFYLAAMLAYLRFDEHPRRSLYFTALGLFTLAVLSKTVTASLPAAILVIFWWQRGALRWRRDVLPLIPFFAIGVAVGLLSAWVEHFVIGAKGDDFQFNLLERSLIAGRVCWFYLAKLLWPAELLFFYPRWQINASVWWQYLYPLAAAALLLGLWLIRKRSRAPLAAFLFFGGTLFPVMGFLNVYPFRFSFVADHFQYLASLGVISLFAASITLALRRLSSKPTPTLATLALALALTLATLTRAQTHMYADAETLYNAAVQRNPEAWLAHNNLGVVLLNSGRFEDAATHIRETLRLKPDYPEAHLNWGDYLARTGRLNEAVESYSKAIDLQPGYLAALLNWGVALKNMGRLDDAVQKYEEALRIKPDYAEAHHNLGNVLTSQGRFEESLAHYAKAAELRPYIAGIHLNWAIPLRRLGRNQEAIQHYSKALQIDPTLASAHINWGLLLVETGHLPEAERQFRNAVEVAPTHIDGYMYLADLYGRQQRFDDAIGLYKKVLLIRPNLPEAYNGWGLALAMQGRIPEAAAQFREALRLAPNFAAAAENLRRAESLMR